MKKTVYTHISGSDALGLSVLRIEPDNADEIKGIVQLVHGMNEHKERYIDFMEFLARNGYLTVLHDHRGHGASVKSPDDLGYMYENGYEALIEDVHEITNEIKDYAKELTGKESLPLILLGHSMGSMAVRCYIRKYDSEIQKLIVIGCPSKLSGTGFGLFITGLFRNLFGDRKRSAFIKTLIMGSYEKRFKKENVPGSWINTNLDEVRKYSENPLCNYTFTLNGFYNLVKLSMLTYKDGGYALNNPSLPIRFFSGADDPCAINEKAFFAAVNLLKKQGYTDVEGKMYPGMRHEILNSPEKETVYNEILSFIENP